MEKSNSNGGALCHHLLIIFLLCFNPSSSSAAETQFFVNCGSTTAVNADDGRVFAADQPPENFKLDGGSQILSDPANATASSLYKTAREFTRRSGYDFPVPENTSYLLLRLHFAAFNPRLSAARFDVHASNFILLGNFTAENSTAGAPLISEFYLPAASRNRLRIRFIPSSDSLAFVSAIELLPLTSSFFVDNRSAAVPPGGGSRPAAGFFGFQSSALRTVHRVDIGGGSRGGEIPPDSLFRPWRPDNEFYATASLGNESDTAIIPSGAADRIRDLAASEPALGSCRYERVTNGGERPANLTWRFQVKQNTRQFLRLYFLNCVNDAAIRDFNLYINTNFPATVDPFLYLREFVADSDGSGFFEISISPSPAVENGVATAAYLNALEILEFLPKTPANETDDGGNHSNHHRRNLAIWLSAAAAAAAVVVLISLIAFLLKRKKKKNNNKGSNSVKNSATGEKKSHSWITVHTDNTTTQGSPLPELNLKLKMPLSEILAVTDNFNPKLLIGSGGFGKVYEGKLANGVTVAVKRSESGHGQGRPEFQTEVLVLSKIRHRHLVSLIGYCDDGAEMILVYEFMKNGTLRDHLYRSDATMLNWKQRLEICIGSAKGLHYLHTGSDGGIIHRDVKSTNILLDENYVAKVADFGLSQAGLPDPDHHSMALKGSFGYLDPEFFRTFQLTDKSDVYSFGVVLLEVVCARPAIVNSTAARREEINLAEWGMAWQKKGEIEKIVDPSILGEMNPSSLRKFAEVAEKCLRPDGVDRPTMLDVCWDLEYALQLQQGTPARREPSEDSMMDDASSNILRPIVSGFRDTSFIVGEEDDDDDDDDDDDEMSAGDDSAGDVDATATDSGSVFSQHRVDGAR
ncbi:unnamed protein product [Linum tenue]|uniref:Protein kinase domain-containing protein n=1 Tax=Linum tenue TaxID=586396 RepID=A0AAV0P7S3_9ROSI|nr:unnamed protein product [Linum tenue]